jgi:nitrate/TMAO reductase-like tetraheme cytochrome c subunit
LVDETRKPHEPGENVDEPTSGQGGKAGNGLGEGANPSDSDPKYGDRWLASATIRIALPKLLLNPISIAGAILAVGSALLIVLFVVVEINSAGSNPYLSIVGFLFLPALLVIGMLAVPIGALLTRRRARRSAAAGIAYVPTLPVIDFNNRSHQRAVLLIAVGGVVAFGLIATAGVQGFAFGESPAFCGLVCHRVMKPEYVAYTSSTHARVACVSCHIGPGTPWFVKSKLTGISQLANYSLNTYPRPIPAPVESLRPSRDTCEQCHWPERLYGDRLQVVKTYGSDATNALNEQTIVFRVGGGSASEGVHWHVANELEYLPLDQERQDIGWVQVKRSDGSVETYLDPTVGASITTAQIEAGKRRMDCIDCHNRVAHEFKSYQQEVDRAFTDGRLDTSLQYLKLQAIALGPQDTAHPLAEDSATVTARLATLPAVYQRDYPAIYKAQQVAIVAASKELISIYEGTVFAEMGVDSGTYPSNIGHVDGGGCARCHGKLSLVVKGKLTEQASNRCDLCHYAPVTTLPSAPDAPGATSASQSAKPPAIPHPVSGTQSGCLFCHGRNDPIPVPVSHAGRTNDMCLLCHRPAAAQ